MSYTYTTRATCRSCSGSLKPFFDLGDIHVSDFLLAGDPVGQPLPLNLHTCAACGLVQLSATVPRDQLYREYWYRSGVNESMVRALREILLRALSIVILQPGDAVIDIGANDGTLLRQYRELLGPRVSEISLVGFDPAQNLTDELAASCNIVIPDYFPARRYDGPKARIITSIAMFYDLEDPAEFVQEIKRVLHPHGVWICQFGDLASMYEQNAFDAICHEHLAYWSLGLFKELCERAGLQVIGAEKNEVNGGSLRVFVQHVEKDPQELPWCPPLESLLVEEQLVINHADEFPARIEGIRGDILRVAERALQTGIVDVYGASTKGNTLLQFCRLGPGFGRPIRQAIERSSAKWGRFTVGSQIPIVSEAAGREKPADLWVVLPWHFKEGILKRERAFLEGGGKIFFPLPKPSTFELPDFGL